MRRKCAITGSRRESKAAVFMTKQKEKKTRFPLVPLRASPNNLETSHMVLPSKGPPPSP